MMSDYMKWQNFFFFHKMVGTRADDIISEGQCF